MCRFKRQYGIWYTECGRTVDMLLPQDRTGIHCPYCCTPITTEDDTPDTGEEDREMLNPASLRCGEPQECGVEGCTNRQQPDTMGEVDANTPQGEHYTLLVCDEHYESMTPPATQED